MNATARPARRRPADPAGNVALVLQGGGALGSYQAGVYEVLAASPYQPNWIAGISIGAINAALIAGNPPEMRVARLQEFWQGVTARPSGLPDVARDLLAPWRHMLSAQAAVMLGQPGFFTPRQPLDWLGRGPASYYTTDALRATLERMVDFDRIGARGEMRLCVGVVNVRTGQFSYFDSDRIKLRAQHVMASAALPPSFPAVEIEGEHYWDGGMVSNTPLAYVLDHMPNRAMMAFQVDLFQAHGIVPATLDQVAERDKDIRYSSRTRVSTDLHAEKHEMRHAIADLLDRLPPEIRETDQAKRLMRLGNVGSVDLVHLIYRPFCPQGSTKDYEFSRETMEDRWRQGVEDAALTISAAPWQVPCPPEKGIRVFDVIHDLLVAGKHPAQPARPSTSRVSSPRTAEDRLAGTAAGKAGE